MKLPEVFAKPWEYPGLVSRRQSKRRLKLLELPSFAPETLWALFQEPAGSWSVRRIHRGLQQYPPGIDRPSFGADGVVANEAIDSALAALHQIQIPVAWPGAIGIDGVIRRLWCPSGFSSVEVTWWQDPAELQELNAWFESATSTFGQTLPAYSVGS